jgi:regulator of cell morphogenesis and NO signaling
MTITENSLIADIATGIPSSVRVFQRHGVDFCCGGKRPLKTACDELGLSFARVARDIEASSHHRDSARKDWSAASLQELMHHIVASYHAALREELPRLVTLVEKVARAHGANMPGVLDQIERSVRALSTELFAHMQTEEQVVFPAITALVCGGSRDAALLHVIAAMESEHEGAGALLADLRTATGGFAPPEWGCATTVALYKGLAELEAEMHLHVHLENNVLFPRALALSELIRASSCTRRS